MSGKNRYADLGCTINIFLCFLLTSTGYFLWMNHLEHMLSADAANVMTTVIGYFLQAAGIGLFALLQRRGNIASRTIFVASLMLYAVLLVPASYSHTLLATLAFGFAESLNCGVIAGHYLYRLTAGVPSKIRATSFGAAYGLATVASWLLSLVPRVYENGVAVAVCAALAIAAAFTELYPQKCEKEAVVSERKTLSLKNTLWLSAAVILLFSLVHNMGFVTQSTPLSDEMHLEFSRMFYAVGLLAAGIVSDKSRKNGAVCALAALAIPFISLALQGELVPYAVFWAFSYFGFGFYAVYRIIAFSDLAERNGLLFLAGFGLLLGRIGDAAGTGMYLMLKTKRIALIVAAAMLFAVSVFLFFRLYQLLYTSLSRRVKSEQEIFHEFAAKHDLSQREREVMKLLLADKTNKEIAETLFVSESTAKFHVHNLLKKTGAKSRLELIALYTQTAQQSAQN